MAVIDYCTPLPDLQPLFVAAVALSFAVIAFFFMLGRAISRSDFEGWARKELRETIVAVLIALAIVGLAGISCEGTRAVLSDYAPGYTQFTYSYEYLNVLTQQMGVPAIQSMWLISYTLKNAQFEIPLGKGITWDPLSLTSTYASVIERMSGLLFTPFVGSLYAQLIFLQLSQAFAFTLLLPIGVVLRAIPLARKGGSFLIALSFGLYVVLPLMYVVNYDISKKVWPGFDEYMNQFNSAQPHTVLSAIFDRVWSPIQTVTKILPQATVLAMLNLTIFFTFVEVFTKFIDDIG